ncbi:uncharacterized protein I206_104409 [Kwoniella pini CBS 10737]|uniref:Uncharacterized protein n=1 Tax=Kwoniella pini CBS 10737 TaxID=1296096 RepID=A0A1B9I1U2_9TREE|nr:uncharacterized protein I206_04008 [Kwoniella pini CBS 10737]OCF49487.1 hypothetical protein I206_04008 [Kwoniella pini CBS 10737]
MSSSSTNYDAHMTNNTASERLTRLKEEIEAFKSLANNRMKQSRKSYNLGEDPEKLAEGICDTSEFLFEAPDISREGVRDAKAMRDELYEAVKLVETADKLSNTAKSLHDRFSKCNTDRDNCPRIKKPELTGPGKTFLNSFIDLYLSKGIINKTIPQIEASHPLYAEYEKYFDEGARTDLKDRSKSFKDLYWEYYLDPVNPFQYPTDGTSTQS